MKRYILTILILALCLAACVSCKGNDAPAESTPADSAPVAPAESTPSETEPEPETEPCLHDFSGGWKQDELYHWQECTKCGYYEKVEGHTDELAFVGQAPTDTEDGFGFYVCQVCGRMEKQDIPAGTVIETE